MLQTAVYRQRGHRGPAEPFDALGIFDPQFQQSSGRADCLNRTGAQGIGEKFQPQLPVTSLAYAIEQLVVRTPVLLEIETDIEKGLTQ